MSRTGCEGECVAVSRRPKLRTGRRNFSCIWRHYLLVRNTAARARKMSSRRLPLTECTELTRRGSAASSIGVSATGTALFMGRGASDPSQIPETSILRRMTSWGRPMNSVIRILSTFGKPGAGAGNERSRDFGLLSSCTVESRSFPAYGMWSKCFARRGTGRRPQRGLVGGGVAPSGGEFGNKVSGQCHKRDICIT
jgi:hypothetical protein